MNRNCTRALIVRALIVRGLIVRGLIVRPVIVRAVIVVFAVALLWGNSQAQAAQNPPNASPPDTTAPPAAQANSTAAASPAHVAALSRLAAGSVIPAQLTKTIDARKVKTGDEVVAKVTQDLRNDAGTVILTKDSRIVGHVTEAQARSKDKSKDKNKDNEKQPSQVAIAFDHVIPKSGEPMQMPMSIQAIIAPPSMNSANSSAQTTSGYPGPETAGVPNASGGHAGSMGTTQPSGNTSVPMNGPADTAATAPAAAPAITGNTRGVVGIANLSLSASADAKQGSVVSSDKNNVKIDDGTLLLLHVDQ